MRKRRRRGSDGRRATEEAIDGARRDISRVVQTRKARANAASSINTACRMVACAGACIASISEDAFFARTGRPGLHLHKEEDKRRLLEDDFGRPITRLMPPTIKELDELLKPIRDEQNAAAHIIGQRVKSYFLRQRKLRIEWVLLWPRRRRR